MLGLIVESSAATARLQWIVALVWPPRTPTVTRNYPYTVHCTLAYGGLVVITWDSTETRILLHPRPQSWSYNAKLYWLPTSLS